MKEIDVPLNLGLTVAMVDAIAKKVLVERPEVFKIIRRLNETNLLNIFEVANVTDTTVAEVYSVVATDLYWMIGLKRNLVY